MSKKHNAPTSDAEVRQRIDHAFQFIDQVLDDKAFRDQLPDRATIVISDNAHPMRVFVRSKRADGRRRDKDATVVYVPSKKTAYVRSGKRGRIIPKRVVGTRVFAHAEKQ